MRKGYLAVKWMGLAAAIGLLSATTASATILSYEMDVAPNDASLGTAAMTKVGGGFGDPTYDFDDTNVLSAAGPAGLHSAGHSLDGEGVARFMDTDNSTTANHAAAGFYKTALGDGGNSFTVDMRVKANWSVNGDNVSAGNDAGAGKRSMGIHNGLSTAGQGANIRLSAVPSTPGSGFIEFAGWTGSAQATKRIPVSLTDFHRIRLSLNGTTLTVYDLDNDLDPGAGVQWAVLQTNDGLSAVDLTIFNKPAVAAAIVGQGGGFQINSIDNTARRTQYTDFSLDWLRISTGTALGATDQIIPEPASLGFLALGMIALLWRRNRA